MLIIYNSIEYSFFKKDFPSFLDWLDKNKEEISQGVSSVSPLRDRYGFNGSGFYVQLERLYSEETHTLKSLHALIKNPLALGIDIEEEEIGLKYDVEKGEREDAYSLTIPFP